MIKRTHETKPTPTQAIMGSIQKSRKYKNERF